MSTLGFLSTERLQSCPWQRSGCLIRSHLDSWIPTSSNHYRVRKYKGGHYSKTPSWSANLDRLHTHHQHCNGTDNRQTTFKHPLPSCRTLPWKARVDEHISARLAGFLRWSWQECTLGEAITYKPCVAENKCTCLTVDMFQHAGARLHHPEIRRSWHERIHNTISPYVKLEGYCGCTDDR